MDGLETYTKTGTYCIFSEAFGIIMTYSLITSSTPNLTLYNAS